MKLWRLLTDRISQAILALKDNRLRTLLSIIGIAIGISAVMAVETISKGGSHLVFSELETFGLNSVWVYRDKNDKDPHRQVREGTGIDLEDFLALRDCCSAVKRMSPVVHPKDSPIIQTVNKYSNAAVRGVGRDYLAINNDVLTLGRDFRQREITSRHRVAIVGPTAIADLFKATDNPIGRELRIGRQKFTVIGVLKEKSRDFLASIGSAGGQDANNRILIPYSSLFQINGNEEINMLRVESVSLDQSDLAGRQLITVLQRRNEKYFQYKTETMASYIGTTQRILNGVSVIGIVAASISLLVGGMGIMNIMSTSVLERTREIGLRKALGARRSDILWQFLLEAAVISTIGGLLGLALGVGASMVLASLTAFPVSLSPVTVLIALGASVLVGILSGMLPARNAARLKPVDALRYE